MTGGGESRFGIPNIGAKGFRFRSLLEAKWARFFDLLGWRWQYEPFELNGWIPDFAILGRGATTLVEIKPYSSDDEWTKEINKISRACGLDELYEWQEAGSNGDPPKSFEVLLCGICPTAAGDAHDDCFPFAGLLGDCSPAVITMEMSNDDPIKFPTEFSRVQFPEFGFASRDGSYSDRIIENRKMKYPRCWPELVATYWANACNDNQWRRP